MHPFMTPTLDTDARRTDAPPLPTTGLARTATWRVRRIEPRTVAKATALFHAIVVVSALAALALLYVGLAVAGGLDSVERSIRVFVPGYRLRGASLMSGAAVLGAIEIAIATAVNVVSARIYNLVADGGGAIEVTMVEADS